MRRLLALAAAGVLALPSAALADPQSEDEENPAQTSAALALQALALLEQGRQHEEAEERLDLALEAEEPGEIDLRALRAAHAALHEEDVEQAERLLQRAFPDDEEHVVGVTYRPALGTAQAVSGAAGALALGLAALGLAWQRRRERGTA